MPTIVGTAINDGTSVPLPPHQVGDDIVLFVYRYASLGGGTLPTKPSAGGTVPAWVDISAASGSSNNASRTAHFVATANNHTSGTWTSATGMIAVVLRGQTASPIGGFAETGNTTFPATAPAVALSKTDGSSTILHFVGVNLFGGTAGSFGAPPAGYTAYQGDSMVACFAKDVSTSDGAAAIAYSGTASAWRGATVEILGTLPPPLGFFAMF